MDYKSELLKLFEQKSVTQQEAFAFFDKLPAVELTMLKGKWKGSELSSGHPMDGLLGATRWYGKLFKGKDKVHPLLFEKADGKLFVGNPVRMPLQFCERLPRGIIRIVFMIISPLLATKKYGAVLRMTEYRSKITAAMIYDSQPVIDYFGMVNEDMVLGVTETRWDASLGYFFILEKVK